MGIKKKRRPDPKLLQMGLQPSSGVQCENEAFSQSKHWQGARMSHWTEQWGAKMKGSHRLQRGTVREGL
jgi:hypothetical protein